MEIFFNFSCLFIDRNSFLSPRIHTFPCSPPETSCRFRAAQLSLSIVYWNLPEETSKKKSAARRTETIPKICEHAAADFSAHMAVMHARRFASYFVVIPEISRSDVSMHNKIGKLQINGFTAACPYVLKFFNFGSGESCRLCYLLFRQIEGFQILRNLTLLLRLAFFETNCLAFFGGPCASPCSLATDISVLYCSWYFSLASLRSYSSSSCETLR